MIPTNTYLIDIKTQKIFTVPLKLVPSLLSSYKDFRILQDYKHELAEKVKEKFEEKKQAEQIKPKRKYTKRKDKIKQGLENEK